MAKKTKVETLPVPQVQQDATVQEIEANMMLPEGAEEYDPGAAALTLFAMYGPKFFAMVDRLNKKQAQRLLKSLVTYPLETVVHNKNNKVEHECFKIADRMLTSKFMTVLAYTFVEEQKRNAEQEEKKKAGAAEPVAEVKTNEKPTESDGTNRTDLQ